MAKKTEGAAQHIGNGSTFIFSDGKSIDQVQREKMIGHQTEQAAKIKKQLDESFEKKAATAKEISEIIQGLELMPILNNLIVKPYRENPYNKTEVTESGIIKANYDGSYLSKESGEKENEEQFIIVGKVLECGPECKYIKEGDDVFYTKTSLVPIPFFNQGFQLVNETRIMMVVNEGLKDRLKK